MSTQKTKRVTDEELAFKQFSLPKLLQLSIGDAWEKRALQAMGRTL